MATYLAFAGEGLGAGAVEGRYVPIRPTTCWEFFGFDGPTNRHNLDIKYRERVNGTPTRWETENGITYLRQEYSVGYVNQQYEKCLAEIGEK